MMTRLKTLKDKRQLESILIVCVLLATSIVVIFPLTAPKVSGQIIHDMGQAMLEDGQPTDADGQINQIVVWDNSDTHIVQTQNYLVNPGYTLVIHGLTPPNGISFDLGATRIDVAVDAKLITHDNGADFTRTVFSSSGIGGWDGIYFLPGSEGRILDCEFDGPNNGVIFQGASLMEPGISKSSFINMAAFGIQMDRAVNYTNMDFVVFDDSAAPSAVCLDVRNGTLNLTDGVSFIGHGIGMPSMYVSNANVTLDSVNFNGFDIPGQGLLVEEKSNGTVLDFCEFQGGWPGEYYAKTNGASIFMDNCSFYQGGASAGALTLQANDYSPGFPSHDLLRNPMGIGSDWDNATLGVTGASSITVEWWLDVEVVDPDGHHIISSTVNVSDPSSPDKRLSDALGFARWFLVTEFIQYSGLRSYFDPFNISATNVSSIGYLEPPASVEKSKIVTVVVPFSIIPNTLPKVTWLPTPPGVQSGNITIEYILEDLDPWDDGTLNVTVSYSFDSLIWHYATAMPSSPPTVNLNNNTLYYFYWDSSWDLFEMQVPVIYIQVRPYDAAGRAGGQSGLTLETGAFEVDNQAPSLVGQDPTATPTNTTALVTWFVSEDADAAVWYGLDGVPTMEQTGAVQTPDQSVDLTGLIPGRNYTFYANSTDAMGNKASFGPFWFHTEVHIQLYKGWNMISIPPDIPDPDIADVLLPIAGDYDAVQRYDPSDATDPWKHYNPNKPSQYNDLNQLALNMGLWIHMTTERVFIVNHEVPTPSGAYPIGMFVGWNLVPYPSSIARDVPTALSGGFSWDMVMYFDGASGQWLRYDGVTYFDITQMEIGHAYYVHVTSGGFWNVNYT
ncbi:MAG: hypothetical protein JSW00_10140 [Thermoplasmata archaeon]|nr:MAG: hypothetical protein JSW00_10140 [Thermoplasmata archaeon]